MGHWNQDHMIISYLHTPPVQGMSAIAGHVRGTYLLARETVEPPRELQDLVWPWAQAEFNKVKQVWSDQNWWCFAAPGPAASRCCAPTDYKS